MSRTSEAVTAAAQAANLLSSAVRQAHEAANKSGDGLLELALREPLSMACALDAALYEISQAVADDHAN